HMEFVVSVLRKAAGLSETDAIRTMLDIHAKGGVLLAMASMEEARRVADAVTADARANNHPLVCRAVSLDR
ncbi:MAG: ATP-dependent Clp protease adaptor ClpS, partial [Steroidobacteraceae bacterium]